MESIEVNNKNWKSLIKPAKVDLKLSDDKSYAKIIAEPLEKGYGLTLGNSLRRIIDATIEMAGKKIHTQFTIADRKHMKNKVLIGINTLREDGFLIDPSKE